jgi:anti-sigma B factor antagonist
MGPDDTRLELSVGPDGALILDGEIDSYTAPSLEARLAADPDVAVVDLAGISFIDSSGLRVLVQVHQDRLAADQSLTLRSPSASVQRLLEISGLSTHLDVV